MHVIGEFGLVRSEERGALVSAATDIGEEVEQRCASVLRNSVEFGVDIRMDGSHFGYGLRLVKIRIDTKPCDSASYHMGGVEARYRAGHSSYQVNLGSQAL